MLPKDRRSFISNVLSCDTARMESLTEEIGRLRDASLVGLMTSPWNKKTQTTLIQEVTERLVKSGKDSDMNAMMYYTQILGALLQRISQGIPDPSLHIHDLACRSALVQCLNVLGTSGEPTISGQRSVCLSALLGFTFRPHFVSFLSQWIKTDNNSSVEALYSCIMATMFDECNHVEISENENNMIFQESVTWFLLAVCLRMRSFDRNFASDMDDVPKMMTRDQRWPLIAQACLKSLRSPAYVGKPGIEALTNFFEKVDDSRFTYTVDTAEPDKRSVLSELFMEIQKNTKQVLSALSDYTKDYVSSP